MVLSGVRKTTFESLPVVVNGLPTIGVNAPLAATDQASVIEDAAPPSAAYRNDPSQLNSTPPTRPVPVLANGEPATAVSAPFTPLMLKTDTEAWCETARKRPSPEIFMPTIGVGSNAAVADRLNDPLAAMLKVLIVPLLEAIRK